MYMIREQNRTEAHCDYATDQAVPSNISRLKSCSTHTGKELMCSSSATQTCPTMAAMQGAHFRTAVPSLSLLTCPSCRYLCHLYM